MTRKEKIISTALQLFTANGINNTPTTLIAEKSEVSEALIFRHFGNKKGLLKSCILSQKEKMNDLLEWVSNISSPKQRINYLIQLTSPTSDSHHSSTWTTAVAINNQTLLLDSTFFKAVKTLLESSFTELRYKRPNDEAALLLLILTSLNTLEDQERSTSIVQFLLLKYNV